MSCCHGGMGIPFSVHSVFSRDLILEGKNGGIPCFGGESNGLT